MFQLVISIIVLISLWSGLFIIVDEYLTDIREKEAVKQIVMNYELALNTVAFPISDTYDRSGYVWEVIED